MDIIELSEENILDDAVFSCGTINDCTLDDYHAERMTFKHVIFHNVVFNKIKFKQIDLMGVRFQNCDLSNVDFSKDAEAWGLKNNLDEKIHELVTMH